MIIGVDFDNALADTIWALADYLNDVYKFSFKKGRYDKELINVATATEGESFKRLYDFFASSYIDKIKPVPGSQLAIRRLHQNHKLLILTARHDSLMKPTKEWLNRYFPNLFSGIHYAANSQFPQYSLKGERIEKGDLCKKWGVEILIEDSLTMVQQGARVGIISFLLDRPWNQSRSELSPNIVRVKFWNEILRKIEEYN